MKLFRTKIGKLEYDNYFSYSSFPQFLSDTQWHRDGNYFYLDNNGYIERKINYDSFVIITKRKKFTTEEEGQSFITYVVDEKNQNYGVECTKGSQNQYHKLIYNEGFITVYCSDDGTSWENLGGCPVYESIIRQGFKKQHSERVQLLEYEVYSDPFITFEDFDEEDVIRLYDENDNLINDIKVDSTRTAKLFINNPVRGYIKAFRNECEEYFKSDLLDFSYGEHYIRSEYDFDFIYENKVLEPGSKTVLNDLYSVHDFYIRNNSKYAYTGLTVTVENNTEDIIELSYDNENFSADLDFEIDSKQEVQIYVRILKGPNSPIFSLKDFIVKVTKK